MLISNVKCVITLANFACILCLISSQGAIGKCTSLFKFFEGIMNKRVDSSPVASSAIANEVQPELAHLLSEDSL